MSAIVTIDQPAQLPAVSGKRGAGIYTNLPFAEYIADDLASAPSLNAGTAARLIAECPKSARFHHPRLNPTGPGKKTPAMDAGSICHEILLEGSAARVAVIDPEEHRSKPTKDNPEGAVPAGWTNGAIREARDTARASGKIPILKADFADIGRMVESAEAFIRTSEIADLWPGSVRESTLLWQESGVWCRCRPDAVAHQRVVIDVKSTEVSGGPERWARTQISGHNELQAALGLLGLRRLAPKAKGDPKHVWLVIEQQEPFLTYLVGADPATMAMADEKLAYAIDLWGQCLKSTWSGYPTRIHWASPNAWDQQRWEERE